MGTLFHVITMGCQMNEYDSDLVSQHLAASGLSPTHELERADLVLINTCAVREKAEQKAYSLLGRVLKEKKRRPHIVVGLMGCVAQMEGADLLKRFPGLDLVLGPRELSEINHYLQAFQQGCGALSATRLDLKPPSSPNNPEHFRGKVSSYISIMEGCNNFCSYCVVPFSRGREVSRPLEEIFKEAAHLVSEGVKEITLLGQNVNSYSPDEGQGEGFPGLLRSLSQVEGLLRLRFTTSHPKDLSQGLIDCFKELPLLCPHIHLPVQSGSNPVLTRMNRGYTREEYMERVSRLRAAQPGIAITSDVMVGFPGETDEDFLHTVDLIKMIRFDNLYSFKYSDRKGTRAAAMAGKIDEKEKYERLYHLQRVQRAITLQKNKALENTFEEILVEGMSKKGNQFTGRTGTNKIVNFNNNNNIIGNLTKVLINKSSANSLWGEPR